VEDAWASDTGKGAAGDEKRGREPRGTGMNSKLTPERFKRAAISAIRFCISMLSRRVPGAGLLSPSEINTRVLARELGNEVM
jgi:hypothetical protein